MTEWDCPGWESGGPLGGYCSTLVAGRCDIIVLLPEPSTKLLGPWIVGALDVELVTISA